MSYRFDTPLIPGAYHLGNRALGVLGSIIRASTGTGDHGPGYLFNDLTGADDAKEICGLILTVPAAGTFTTNEDGSFTLVGAPDGAYTFTYRLFADGADLGTSTATITIGTVLPSATLNITTGASVFSGSASSSPLPSGALSDDEMRRMFNWVSDLARIHGLIVGEPLVVTPTTRVAGSVTQTIGESGQTVTVTRY